jgi:hypothetical protein
VNGQAPRSLLGAAALLLAASVIGIVVVEPDPRASTSPNWSGPSATAGRAPARGVSAYAGLGAWIDAYDYAPAYHRPWEGRQLVPEDLDGLSRRGVRTVFLQASRLDRLSPEGIVDRTLVGRFLERGHHVGLRMVGWYLPKLGDLEADLARLRSILDFEFAGHRFDGLGVDIEWRRDVPDHAERNRRLVDLSRRLRQEVGQAALAAIVFPPVLLEVISPRYWPAFPWGELAGLYDVWMPMAYWTEVPAGSGYRHGYRYTTETVQGLRARLGRPSVPVHPIGGVADAATLEDYQGFLRAAAEAGVPGFSVYDYRTTSEPGWELLQRAAPGG